MRNSALKFVLILALASCKEADPAGEGTPTAVALAGEDDGSDGAVAPLPSDESLGGLDGLVQKRKPTVALRMMQEGNEGNLFKSELPVSFTLSDFSRASAVKPGGDSGDGEASESCEHEGIRDIRVLVTRFAEDAKAMQEDALLTASVTRESEKDCAPLVATFILGEAGLWEVTLIASSFDDETAVSTAILSLDPELSKDVQGGLLILRDPLEDGEQVPRYRAKCPAPYAAKPFWSLGAEVIAQGDSFPLVLSHEGLTVLSAQCRASGKDNAKILPLTASVSLVGG